MACWSCFCRCCRCCDSDDSSTGEKRSSRPRRPMKDAAVTRGLSQRQTMPKRLHHSTKSIDAPERSASQNTMSRGRTGKHGSGRERSTSRRKGSRSRSRRAAADQSSAGRHTPGRITPGPSFGVQISQPEDEFARPRPDSQTLAAIDVGTPRLSISSSLNKVTTTDEPSRDKTGSTHSDPVASSPGQPPPRDISMRKASETEEPLLLVRARTGSSSAAGSSYSGGTVVKTLTRSPSTADQPSPTRVMINTSGIVYHLPPRRRSTPRKASVSEGSPPQTSYLADERRTAQLMNSMVSLSPHARLKWRNCVNPEI